MSLPIAHVPCTVQPREDKDKDVCTACKIDILSKKTRWDSESKDVQEVPTVRCYVIPN